jgi:hypothetical protein
MHQQNDYCRYQTIHVHCNYASYNFLIFHQVYQFLFKNYLSLNQISIELTHEMTNKFSNYNKFDTQSIYSIRNEIAILYVKFANHIVDVMIVK